MWQGQWNVYYLEEVEQWLDDLTEQQVKSVSKEIRLLEKCGNLLKLPHSKSLGGGLFELRERRFDLRIYYCFRQGFVAVLVLGGDKSYQQDDITKARRILSKLEEHHYESQKL